MTAIPHDNWYNVRALVMVFGLALAGFAIPLGIFISHSGKRVVYSLEKNLKKGITPLGRVSAETLKDEWPLRVPYLDLYCFVSGQEKGFACVLWGTYEGKSYALNGEAKRLKIDDFLLDIHLILVNQSLSDGRVERPRDITPPLEIAELRCGCGVREPGKSGPTIPPYDYDKIKHGDRPTVP